MTATLEEYRCGCFFPQTFVHTKRRKWWKLTTNIISQTRTMYVLNTAWTILTFWAHFLQHVQIKNILSKDLLFYYVCYCMELTMVKSRSRPSLEVYWFMPILHYACALQSFNHPSLTKAKDKSTPCQMFFKNASVFIRVQSHPHWTLSFSHIFEAKRW